MKAKGTLIKTAEDLCRRGRKSVWSNKHNKAIPIAWLVNIPFRWVMMDLRLRNFYETKEVKK